MHRSPFYRCLVTLLLAMFSVTVLLFRFSPFRIATASGTVGNGTPESRAEEALDAALAGDGQRQRAQRPARRKSVRRVV